MASEQLFGQAVSQAWHGQLDFSGLLDTAAQLEGQGQSHFAAVLYQTWLQRNPSPYAHAAWFNLALSLASAGDNPGAENAYRKALEIHPGFVQPRLNLGMLYERLGQVDRAIAEWRWVADNVSAADQSSAAGSDNAALLVMALNHLGRVMEMRKDYHQACEFLTRSLAIAPKQPDALHHWVHLRQKQCLWPVYTPLPGVTEQEMRDATSALAMLSVSDDPPAQLAAARRYVEKKVQSDVPPLTGHSAYGHRRLRVAYLSSDFCLHPVSMLMAELLELHDREHFEVYAYCWSPQDGSALRQRIIDAVDQFHRIDGLGDAAAAQLIRAHEIDILIDLQGQTAGARANLLAYRPAPIQITYLGLPATTGLPSIDYVIADRFLIPQEYAPFYSEKPLYMPDVYQVSDRQRPVAPAPARSSCGLPEQAFVFCSLNNNYKYTPEVFACWMRILQRCPHSVLWLLSDNSWAEQNIRAQAAAQGVDAGRIVFAGRVAPENYLARYACADLFLDTFPFNAGTTANDALWMGLPILTCTGRSFAARMAGALLHAAELDELITYNLQDYETQAVRLAHDPGTCQRIRARLYEVHQHGALFDTARFARALENRLQQLVAELQ